MTAINLADLPSLADTPVLRQALQERLQASASGWLQAVPLGTQGGLIDHGDTSVSLLGIEIESANLALRVAVFFTEVVGGCNCHDEPTRHPGYAQVDVTIARAGGRVQARAETAAD